MAGLPALGTLIDQRTSTVSRLSGGKLDPSPALVLINLGENGAPAEGPVIQALARIRSRVARDTRIVVMVPVSGRGRTEVAKAVDRYKKSAGDENTCLVDLGQLTFATCDGQHPTAAGHQAIYEAAVPVFGKLLGTAGKRGTE